MDVEEEEEEDEDVEGEMLMRKTDPKTRKHTLCEPAQSKRTWTFHKSNFVWKFTGKMPDPNSVASILCEPAQSKRTWTFHKSHFVWKFTGQMPDVYENTSIEHRAFAVTLRTPSVWPHCLGKNCDFP